MNTTRELLAAVKARHHLTSDYQLAKFLGLSKQRISKNQAGAVMSDAAALAVADALGIERGRVLAIVAAERTKSPAAKKEWTKLAATAAAVLAVIAVQIAQGFEAGNYWTISALAGAITIDPLYIMLMFATVISAGIVSSFRRRAPASWGENKNDNAGQFARG